MRKIKMMAGIGFVATWACALCFAIEIQNDNPGSVFYETLSLALCAAVSVSMLAISIFMNEDAAEIRRLKEKIDSLERAEEQRGLLHEFIDRNDLWPPPGVSMKDYDPRKR